MNLNFLSSLQNIEVSLQGSSFEGCRIEDCQLKRVPSENSHFWRCLYVLRDLFAQVPLISCLPFARTLHHEQREMKELLSRSYIQINKQSLEELLAASPCSSQKKTELLKQIDKVAHLYNEVQKQSTWKKWLDYCRGYDYGALRVDVAKIKESLPELKKIVEENPITEEVPIIPKQMNLKIPQPKGNFLQLAVEHDRNEPRIADPQPGFSIVYSQKTAPQYAEASKLCQSGNHSLAWAEYCEAEYKDRQKGRLPQPPSESLAFYALHQLHIAERLTPEKLKDFLSLSLRNAACLINFDYIWESLRVFPDHILSIGQKYPVIALSLLTTPKFFNELQEGQKRELLGYAIDAFPKAIERNGLTAKQVLNLLDTIESIRTIFKAEDLAICQQIWEVWQSSNVKASFPEENRNAVLTKLYMILGKMDLAGIFDQGKFHFDFERGVASIAQASSISPELQDQLERLFETDDTLEFFLGKYLLENPDFNTHFEKNLQNAFEYLSSIPEQSIHYPKAMKLCGDLLMTQTDTPRWEVSDYYKKALDNRNEEARLFYYITRYVYAQNASGGMYIPSNEEEEYLKDGFEIKGMTLQEARDFAEAATEIQSLS